MNFVLLLFHFCKEALYVLADKLFFILSQFRIRHVEPHFTACFGLKDFVVIPGVLRLGPGINRSALNRAGGVGDDQSGIVVNGVSKTLANRASAHRVVEAEKRRLRLYRFETANFAGELFCEVKGFRIGRDGFLESDFTCFPITDFDGVYQTAMGVRPHHDAVSQNKYRLSEINFQQRLGRGELKRPAVLKETIESLLAQVKQAFAKRGLLGGFHRKQNVPARAFRLFQHGFRYLIDGVALDARSVVRAISAAGARPQKTHKIIQLRRCRYSGARVTGLIFLPDRNRRSNAQDFVHIRFLHAFQKLARIGRQRLDIAALALGIDGVKDQRRLAGAGNARHHRQEIMRDVDIDILQIVNAGATDGKNGLTCDGNARRSV